MATIRSPKQVSQATTKVAGEKAKDSTILAPSKPSPPRPPTNDDLHLLADAFAPVRIDAMGAGTIAEATACSTQAVRHGEQSTEASSLHASIDAKLAEIKTCSTQAAIQAASQAAAEAATRAISQIGEMVATQMAEMSRNVNAQIDELRRRTVRSSPSNDTDVFVPTRRNILGPFDETRNEADHHSAAAADVPRSPYSGLRPTASSVTCQHDTASTVSAGAYRHKLYDLPEFDGNPEDWLIFQAEFKQTTAEYGYSDVQNVSRLRKCLRGKAREAVVCLLINPENVGNAMIMLERQFGKPQYLVASQLKRVNEIAPIEEGRLEQFIPFAAKVATMVAYLDTPRARQHLFNPLMIEELVMKLPQRERREWGRIARDLNAYPSLKDLSAWLDTVAEEISETTVQYSEMSGRSRKTAGKEQKKPYIMLADSTLVANQPRVCGMCTRRNHYISECYWFTILNSDARWKAVRDKQLCGACLGQHDWPECANRKPCGIDECRKLHHPLLHTPNVTQPGQQRRSRNPFRRPIASQPIASSRTDANAQDSPSALQRSATNDHEPPTLSTFNGHVRGAEAKVLFRIVPVKLFGPTRVIDTHALLDEGSSVTLLDEELADELGLAGPEMALNLNWFREKTDTIVSRVVQLQVSGVNQGCESYELRDVRTVKRLKLPTQTVRLDDLHSRYRNLRRLPIAEQDCVQPKLLIGLDHGHLGVSQSTVMGALGDVIAAKTKLGWIVYGTQRRGGNDAAVLHVHATNAMDEVHRIVRDYFTTENFGVYRPSHDLQSDEEKHARYLLRRTTKRVGNQYETGLLWKRAHLPLPPSRDMAVKRLLAVEAKMRKDPTYAESYRRQMSENIRKGYAREMSDAEVNAFSSRTWYLPHFAVVNVNKPGKFRLVFDAAAEVRGISLNSVLSRGPDLHKPLPEVLFAFRIGPVAVCGDIREMFSQIRIRDDDQDAQRFLWRDGDASKPIRTYVMSAMTFGASCSPCSAHYVKDLNAERHRHTNEEAVRCIIDNHYVDDYVASFVTAEKAIEVTRAVTAIHSEGGFELRGFVSNDRRVQSAVGGPAQDDDSRDMQFEHGATDKVLGLFWDASADALVFRCAFARVPPELLAGNRRPTKREMLCLCMSVFDPFGMVANYLIGAKLLIQETWTYGIAWDEPIPDAIYQRWAPWQRELPNIASCNIPRCYSASLATSDDVQLHVFADASELAFAAVAYWRVGRSDGSFDVAFVAGKTRCAPKKLLSIPRLELQAAVLAVRLSAAIRPAHAIDNVRTIYWSDSRTVVCWIRSHHRRYKPFVAHRIAEVLEVSHVDEWRWIPTGENVADDATRPDWSAAFDATSRWLIGPNFLRRPAAEWPAEPNIVIADELPEETKSRFALHADKSEPLIDIDRYSGYMRLLRMTARVLRFVCNARRPRPDRQSGELRVDELRAAEIVLCRQAQRDAYAVEMEDLRRNEVVGRKSCVYRLQPYLDDCGTMRLRGRIDAATQLPMESRRPIILPNKHPLTDLIVANEHARMRHQNDDAVVCALRERFWIVHARTAVRRVKRRCQRCKIVAAKPIAPQMGPLPADRVLPAQRPFTYVGLDYFGPVHVAVGRRREKRWVALFTCLSVRAVHLELAADMTTDACILCIRNFVNIRGVPSRIRSDNGTNFVGADRELRACIDAFDQDALERECTARGIDWRFNCPSNPEAGGSWERLVRSVKRVLSVTLTETAPRVETMRSLLLEAANIVNSRPLTHLPVSHEDEEPLTPNHFILGGTSSTQSPGPLDPRAHCSRKQWRVLQELKNRFWHRWTREYLPELCRRTKWFDAAKPLAVGDLVIICDETTSRNLWPRGRIAEVFPGADGQVRTALVRTARGELKRPACKLAVLDVTARADGGENPPGLVTGGAVADAGAR